ncbi:MAG: InlB B-repeat-containing protein, partial [Planctomycetota bacterium]
ISVTANFTIDTFTVDYTAGAGGSLTGETAQVVAYGADATAVTAVADTGYSFVDWSDGSTDNPRTDLAVTANITVTANFVADTFTITSSAGVDGSIDPNGLVTVAYGSNQVYTATPDAGYRVNKWLLDGSQDQAGGTVYTLSDITANHTVTVTFK